MNLLFIYGEDHTTSTRLKINDEIRKQHLVHPFQYLILEEIGDKSYFTNKEKEKAIKDKAYNVGPMGLKLAIELNIPAIGMDLWDKDVYKEDEFDTNNFALNVVRSFKLRENNMCSIILEYFKQGNCAVIVGDTHLRITKTKQLGEASPIYTRFHAIKGCTIIRCENKEIE